ncbi:MAG TPA: hypothetical protein DCZ94_06440 [Lentisphaeria bacterium]|nr:MAG: hypothetical protein A2X48_05840 [Lentisphaerae bacterium GWF2_49_21]HBC86575.1 hypothetical protein [Lentisphaeria bacterium]
MNISQPLLLEGPEWACLFSPGERERLSFKCAGTDLLSISGMAFGKFDESSAYCGKLKKHEAIDGLNCSLEAVNVLPYGSEPTVTRKCDIAGNHAVVTTDFELRSKMEADAFEVDNLLVKGTWTRVGVVRISNPVPALSDIQWHELDEDRPFHLELKQIPLLMLFERQDKFMLEIGNGDDLWRWLNTSLFPQSTQSVVIEKAQGGISLRRKVAVWEVDAVIFSRSYRFNWYFAWELPGRKYLGCGDEPGGHGKGSEGMEYFKFPEGEVPQQLAACHGNRNLGVSCFHSPAVSGIFRDIIRASAGKSQGKSIVLGNLSVPLCDSAAHLERPQRQLLLHWNMTRLFDYWLWANKHLKNSGSTFYAVPAKNDRIFSVLPSIRGLSQVRD